jgi:hypothetical protein
MTQRGKESDPSEEPDEFSKRLSAFGCGFLLGLSAIAGLVLIWIFFR